MNNLYIHDYLQFAYECERMTTGFLPPNFLWSQDYILFEITLYNLIIEEQIVTIGMY